MQWGQVPRGACDFNSIRRPPSMRERHTPQRFPSSWPMATPPQRAEVFSYKDRMSGFTKSAIGWRWDCSRAMAFLREPPCSRNSATRRASSTSTSSWAFDDPAQRGRWEEPGAPDAIWRRYGELWCQAASDKSQPFTVMSHPDLPKKFAYYPTFGLQPFYEEMAEAVASAGRMIEVNTSGAYYACAEMFPAPGLLRAFCRAGVPATVGTDAHTPANVTRDIERGYKALYEAGYRVVTVPTSTKDRRRITIE